MITNATSFSNLSAVKQVLNTTLNQPSQSSSTGVANYVM